jgi:small GTP-binding protein
MLGAQGVGKTSIVNVITHNPFDLTPVPTVGSGLQCTEIYNSDDVLVSLHICDTAGQERFRSLVPLYIKNQQVAVLVFSLARPETMNELCTYVDMIMNHYSPDNMPALYVVGNQRDLVDGEPESVMAVNYANSIGAKYFETSAQTGYNVKELFVEIASDLPGSNVKITPAVVVPKEPEENADDSCC